MHDVIGAYQRLEQMYRLYLKSAFPLRSPVLGDERDRVLIRPGVLSQPPLIEPVPVYEPSGLDLAGATARLPSEYRDLVALGQKLFSPGMTLYRHQMESLEEVIINRRDLVVTTGTGSGKTESFLLPLLAQLARESATWQASGTLPLNHNWWEGQKGATERISQWKHINRPSALRAIILYPLNALVEDQLRRLRIALDSSDMHAWLDKHRGRNRITFGRYTGQTPVSGSKEKSQRVLQLRDTLREIAGQRQDLLNAQGQPGFDPDILYYFPRLDGGEMWSRWDMQETPPDILITNYSMLNIMMMRSIEDNIFEQTRQWLAEPEHPEREFFLIVDELHAYRGTPGTEVAYILRLLLSRLGLTPDSPKLRILTTTASIDDNPKGRDFLRQFFGRDQFAFIRGQQALPTRGTRLRMLPHRTAFEDFARSIQPDPLAAPPNPDSVTVRAEMDRLASRIGGARGATAEERLGQALLNNQAHEALRDACREQDQEPDHQKKTVRAAKAPELDKQLFSGSNNNGDAITSDAMRGFMLALGMTRHSTPPRSPQPVRGHLFFHHLLNLWACCNPDCTDPSVDQVARQNATPELRPTVGAVYSTHRLTCQSPTCGSRVLDFIVCEVCGEVLLGGYRATRQVGTKQLTILTADQPDLEQMPDRVDTGQRFKDYAIFWPLPHDAPWTVEPQDREWTQEKITRKWIPAKLDRTTGLLMQDATPPKMNEVPGWLYHIPGTKGSNEPAMPSKCPRCDADYHYRETFKTPLRNHRSGFQKACQVLASALFREMSPFEQQPVARTRKLVIFSDSRQDAAKLAAGMERDHFRDMVRLAMIKALNEYWNGLVTYLKSEVSPGSIAEQMLLSLNPTLYAAVLALTSEDSDAAARFDSSLPPAISKEAGRWTTGKAAMNQQARGEWEALLRDYPGAVPLDVLRGKVFEKLLQAGISPGGSEFKKKNYYDQQQKRWHPWFTCYDWNNDTVQELVIPNELQDRHIRRMSDTLLGELMYALFPHLARTIEGLGQARVSYKANAAVPNDIRTATEAVIRQMGVRRLHAFAERRFYAGNNDSLRRFSLLYIQNRNLRDLDVHQQLTQSGAGMPSANGLVLNPLNIAVMPYSQGSTIGLQGYRCSRCNAFFLADVGICPECIQPTPLIADSMRGDFDYYTRLTDSQYSIFRMNSEELTGQTDRIERPRRQRRFQEVFLNDEIRPVQGVDLLSVTTTMEAGVDIGGLNVVMMANMPPRRFNYQQRVGRAGRRGTGVSLAVTFCRGRSHDDFYYVRPEKMTGDPPPPPYVDLRSEEIYRRVLIKEVLRALWELPCRIPGFSASGSAKLAIRNMKRRSRERALLGWHSDATEANRRTHVFHGHSRRAVLRQAFRSNPSLNISADGDNVHGEFGGFSEWETDYEPVIHAWLQDPSNRPLIEDIIAALAVETPWEGLSGVTFRDNMYAFLRDELADRITETVTDPSYTQEALSEQLANAGLLPMFGFPTRVRLLYTDWRYIADVWPPENGTVDRNLDLAISQFAPGSETVKDKAVHTAVGVVDLYRKGRYVKVDEGFYPPLAVGNQTPLGFCSNCQAVTRLQPMQAPPQGGVEPPLQMCSVCSSVSLRPVDAREPKAFFTNLEPRDFDGQFEWQPRATRPTLGIEPPTVPPAVAGNSSLSTLYRDILSVNDNGGKGGFDFRQAKVDRKLQPGAYVVMTDDDATERVGGHGNPVRIALLAKRKTDILLVNIDQWPQGVFADPTAVEGRAAWYSFAFWLRIAAGAHLDVDPQELQAGLRSVPSNLHSVAGQAFLCDQLENGAGYCRFLGNSTEFTQLLAQADPATPNSIAEKWLRSSEHAGCDTSCNLCLRDFYNLPYHGLLDWRLALDMARLAASPNATVDLVTPWGSTPNPWISLTSGPNTTIPATMLRLNYGNLEQFGTLQGCTHATKGIVVIQRHPLWNDQHPEWQQALQVAQAMHPKAQVKPMNPFRLIRRPADYV